MDRKANESYLDYVRRCTQALEDKVIDYTEWGDALLGAENVYSVDNLRKAFYVIAKILPKLDVSQFSLNTNEEAERLEELQKEIIKERIKCRDQRRELQKYITSEARFDNLVEVLREEIKNIEKQDKSKIDNSNNVETQKYNNSNYAILCLSDWHVGAVVDNEWNKFNIDILKRRVRQLYDKTLYHLQKNNVDNLVIEICGDLIEGLVTVSSQIQSEEGVINQVMIASDILSDLIRDFAIEISKVQVVFTTGNHGRLVPDKSASITKDNVERLIQKYVLLRLHEYNNVTFICSDNDLAKYTIKDKVICVAHGQYDKPDRAIEHFAKLYKIVPDEIHLGHTHSFKEINESGIRIVVNGSLKGADDYSVNVCRGVNKSSQNLIIFGLDRATYELILD